MIHRIKVIFFQVALLLGVVCLLASVAHAETVIKHSHHSKAGVDSPFDSSLKAKPLHCILKLHQHEKSGFCPHHNRSGNNDHAEFRSDCGPQSGSANSSSASFAKKLSQSSTGSNVAPFLFSSRINTTLAFDSSRLPRSVDRPPQLS